MLAVHSGAVPDGLAGLDKECPAMETLLMVDQDSLIKARYAMLVLKNARHAGPEPAIKLLQSVTSDFPGPGTSEKIAALHRDAIQAFKELLDSVQHNRDASVQWQNALLIAGRWHDALK
jgi:hypothetical protein